MGARPASVRRDEGHGPVEQCGWLRDRYGLSWHLVPIVLGELMRSGDRARAGRVMQAMLGVGKIDLAGLRRAYEGTAPSRRQDMASSSKGHFVWYEHLTGDVEAAIAFYGEVLGWKTQPFGGDYTMWVGSQGPLGGVMKLPDDLANKGVPPHWMAHVQVDDVDATATLATRLGGKVSPNASGPTSRRRSHHPALRRDRGARRRPARRPPHRGYDAARPLRGASRIRTWARCGR